MNYDAKKVQESKAKIVYKNGRVYNWFSNFEASPINIGGRIWPDVETYFQAMKTHTFELQEQIRTCGSPSKAKKLGRNLRLRRDWDEVKEGYMHEALMAKFADKKWSDKLLATGDELIIEWNNWGDRIWGMSLDGQGQNKLGEILMEIRDNIR